MIPSPTHHADLPTFQGLDLRRRRACTAAGAAGPQVATKGFAAVSRVERPLPTMDIEAETHEADRDVSETITARGGGEVEPSSK